MPQAMPLSNKISTESMSKISQRIILSKFGDGYSQRAADGINSRVDNWDVKWIPLDDADMQTVVAALDTVGGWDYIIWTSPIDASPKRYILTDGYSITPVARRFIISATFQQVFDL